MIVKSIDKRRPLNWADKYQAIFVPHTYLCFFIIFREGDDVQLMHP